MSTRTPCAVLLALTLGACATDPPQQQSTAQTDDDAAMHGSDADVGADTTSADTSTTDTATADASQADANRPDASRADVGVATSGPPPLDCTAPTVGNTFTMSGIVARLGGGGPPLSGHKVCITHLNCAAVSMCTTIDDAKTFSFDNIPEGSFVVLEFGDNDYSTERIPFIAHEADNSRRLFRPVAKATFQALLQFAGANQDNSNGILVYQTLTPTNHLMDLGIGGVAVALEPQAGDGPLYTNQDGLPDRDLTETTINSTAAYLNVPPGGYDLTATGEPTGCHVFASDESSLARLAANIEPGKITVVQTLCPAAN